MCYGAVSKSNVFQNKSQIIGIDYDDKKLNQAMVNNKYKNLKFMNLMLQNQFQKVIGRL